MSAINLCDKSFVISLFIMLTLTVDTVLGSALSPLSVITVLFTITEAISLVLVNVHTSGSIYTNSGVTMAKKWPIS